MKGNTCSQAHPNFLSTCERGQDMGEVHMYSMSLTLLSSLANVATSNTSRFPCSEMAPM